MKSLKEAFLSGSRGYLVVVVTAASVVTILNTFMTYTNARKAAEEALRLQALAVAASLEPSLGRAIRDRDNIFSDILRKGTWAGIAFVGLYDDQGLTVLHSNENLAGRRIADQGFAETIGKGDPAVSSMTLGTGERVFILDYPVSPEGASMILRISLHTYPVEAVVRQARVQVVSVMILISLLWLIGYFFMRALRSAEEMKKRMEARERFAVMGEMASVLAHEIRNPLGSIKGFAQYILEQTDRDTGGKGPEMGGDNRARAGAARAREFLGIIIDESVRLETLTRDLLLFARPEEVRVRPINLLEAVSESLKALERDDERRPSVMIETMIPPGLHVMTDGDKLKQVLVNVLQNAVDAVGAEGCVTVGAREEKQSIRLSVRDNGCGMDSEAKSKVFQPFFTTKTKGTGLGLAIVDRLVTALGGEIGIDSSPQQGTVVTIVLPIRPVGVIGVQNEPSSCNGKAGRSASEPR
jgi:two-component system sensor histidine kinase HydH